MQNQTPVNWPFPTYNEVRTPESQKLLDTKRFPVQKLNTEEYEEALF
jgi:hypothetical protein